MKQNLAKLMEAELDKAETILAVKDMGDKIQDMTETVAKMRVDTVMPLTEKIKDQFGIPAGEAFQQEMDSLLEGLQNDLSTAKSAVDNQAATLNGEEVPMDTAMSGMPGDDMGGMDDMGMDDMGASDGGFDMDAAFGADDVNVGGDDPMGRAKFESKKTILKKMRVLEAKMRRYKA